MSLSTFLNQIKSNEHISFNDTMAIINEYYNYTPSTFTNGLGESSSVTNEAGTNEGSCKIFAFALLNQLDPTQTLKLFGDYYQEVLNDPEGNSHQNIRNFMQDGWQGISFQISDSLRLK